MAIKHIPRCLKGTRDKDIIMKPSMIENLQFNLYADADFTGLFVSEDKANSISVRSRIGIFFNIGRCTNLLETKIAKRDIVFYSRR